MKAVELVVPIVAPDPAVMVDVVVVFALNVRHVPGSQFVGKVTVVASVKNIKNALLIFIKPMKDKKSFACNKP